MLITCPKRSKGCQTIKRTFLHAPAFTQYKFINQWNLHIQPISLLDLGILTVTGAKVRCSQGHGHKH